MFELRLGTIIAKIEDLGTLTLQEASLSLLFYVVPFSFFLQVNLYGLTCEGKKEEKSNDVKAFNAYPLPSRHLTPPFFSTLFCLAFLFIPLPQCQDKTLMAKE